MNPKITTQHLSKPAYIYIRQSTLAQVRHHQESTERQYALRDKALALGWSETAIRVLDRDLQIVVNGLWAARQPASCPHGRPTRVRVPRDDVSRWFRRT